MFRFAATLLCLAVLFACDTKPKNDPPPSPPPVPARDTVVVKMVYVPGIHNMSYRPERFAFEPAEILVRDRAVIRFVQTGTMPHNVEFREVPAGARIDDIRTSPLLLDPGDTYDIVIDERFAPGTYHYVCTPHESVGMKGSFRVVFAH